jgi:hypothetical protein
VLGRLTRWLSSSRATRAPQPPEVEAPGAASITYYGRLGEMGHPDDRADDWPPAHTGVAP